MKLDTDPSRNTPMSIFLARQGRCLRGIVNILARF